MKFLIKTLLLILSLSAFSQEDLASNYDKKEIYITMRDGVKLFTSIYIPKDISKDKKYPFLMQRTCYSVAPYGEENFKKSIGPNTFLSEDKYIFVYQDVRGRYMSEGTFTNMTPQVEHKNKKNVDESTDTYDTIEWLIKNIKNNNGKVGQYGTSYPGFYTAVGTLANHPALVASSPQAPISDFFFDDFHHNGAFLMGYFKTFPVFGVQKTKAEDKAWYMDQYIRPTSKDGSVFYNELGTVKEATDKYYKDNFFMQEIIEHPNYDDFWQKRNLLPHLKGINHAVMTVGGWYDAEDLTGPLNIYKTIEKTSPKAKNTIVMGPFSHGGWSREKGKHFHNDIYFGDSIATFYQKNIEYKFFDHYLKGDSKTTVALPEAYMFDTGKKEWNEFTNWPPNKASKLNFYLSSNGKLETNKSSKIEFTEYYSDPNNPVPSSINYADFNGFTPRNYMSEDQRFALSRPDVITFTTDYLTEDTTLAGEIMAKLKIASSSTDADFVIKLIDIYPLDEPENKDKPNVIYANYHQMVRSEIMPARFRNSFEKPEALTPNTTTEVNFRLQDVLHTFKKGHKIQIQIQSTWYPLIAVNPQKFLENPYLANKEDYTKAFIKVFNDSYIEVDVLK
ncbi:CocE/NonD family hydrolase [Flavobacterium sediminilitoris]|uniref:CocE/NonD family hydrolase n=1 Tax=Flavobacterium sediminilitoris TaxID=2024526 RepID=A0ABY4HI23_9FLAO|nr:MULTISPECIES: CocE/NonD family hydrolase [Flavobacterium]UOX32489.1 CocE/NonD family hydrolase [Flavobacterium sediminilitoris]